MLFEWLQHEQYSLSLLTSLTHIQLHPTHLPKFPVSESSLENGDTSMAERKYLPPGAAPRARAQTNNLPVQKNDASQPQAAKPEQSPVRTHF